MLLIRLSDEKYPYSIDELRREYPTTSFPDVIDSTIAQSFGADVVEPTPEPTCAWNEVTQQSVERDLVAGKWKQSWIKVSLPTSVANQRLADQWENVRGDRDSRLAGCDWTQLPDNQLSDVKRNEWKTYRQALRDITTQTDPFAISWPLKPI